MSRAPRGVDLRLDEEVGLALRPEDRLERVPMAWTKDDGRCGLGVTFRQQLAIMTVPAVEE